MPRASTLLLQRLARALKRHLPMAVAGDDRGVHQARVTSRRLREAVPVLATGLKGSKAGKARGKIRRLTRALGTVRELDVTIQLLDELARSPHVSRIAVEDVRARVLKEREDRRKLMLERLEHVNTDKIDRRLSSVGTALQTIDGRTVAKGAGWPAAAAIPPPDDRDGRSGAHVRTGAPARGAHRGEETAVRARAGSGQRPAPGAPHVRTIKRAQDMLGKLHDLQVLQTHVAAVQTEPRPGRAPSREALEDLARHIEDQCRHLHGRYVATAPRCARLRSRCAR